MLNPGAYRSIGYIRNVNRKQPATPASRKQCTFSKPLRNLELTVVSDTVCSRWFRPIHCDFIAAFSRWVSSAWSMEIAITALRIPVLTSVCVEKSRFDAFFCFRDRKLIGRSIRGAGGSESGVLYKLYGGGRDSPIAFSDDRLVRWKFFTVCTR